MHLINVLLNSQASINNDAVPYTQSKITSVSDGNPTPAQKVPIQRVVLQLNFPRRIHSRLSLQITAQLCYTSWLVGEPRHPGWASPSLHVVLWYIPKYE